MQDFSAKIQNWISEQTNSHDIVVWSIRDHMTHRVIKDEYFGMWSGSIDINNERDLDSSCESPDDFEIFNNIIDMIIKSSTHKKIEIRISETQDYAVGKTWQKTFEFIPDILAVDKDVMGKQMVSQQSSHESQIRQYQQMLTDERAYTAQLRREMAEMRQEINSIAKHSAKNTIRMIEPVTEGMNLVTDAMRNAIDIRIEAAEAEAEAIANQNPLEKAKAESEIERQKQQNPIYAMIQGALTPIVTAGVATGIAGIAKKFNLDIKQITELGSVLKTLNNMSNEFNQIEEPGDTTDSFDKNAFDGVDIDKLLPEAKSDE